MFVFRPIAIKELIEKALRGSMRDDHDYIYRRPIAEKKSGKSIRRYEYIYEKDRQFRPIEMLKKFFGIGQKELDVSYEKNNIKKDFNADKKTFAQHLLEYFSHRSEWDRKFAPKEKQEKFDKPVKMATFKETKVIDKDMETPAPENDQLELFSAKEMKVKKEPEWKANPYLMRRIWGMFTGKTIEQQKKKETVEAENIIETPTETKETKVTETVDKTPFDIAQETGNNVEAIAAAMKERQNKDIVKEQKNIEADKAEFKALVDRYNELEKEYKANGGLSNRRTTQEENEKRRAARKGLNEVEEKIREFRNRIEEEGKDSFRISSVYTDVLNEWIKRKVKGQTVSTDWLYKKLGGYGSSELPFADGYTLALSDTENINNPVVRISYKEYGSPYFVAVDVGEMGNENYRPRFMPRTDEAFNEVYKKLDMLKKQLYNAPGNTMAEKLFNTVAGQSNAYNDRPDNTNIPRYRFTKDGIKDESGKLEKIDAVIREEDGKEYIRLYADDYGASIPSIFYPENNTDSQTDYFEKDHCAVSSDHPYFNHLKVMALKNQLYRERATKYGSMSEEQQKALEKQIKDLEKQLVEPTEEELTAYRERRDVEEKNKERWEEAKRAVYRKEQEKREKEKKEEQVKRFTEVISKLYEAYAGETPLALDGLSKEDKIKALEDRILKLGFEINSIDDDKVAARKKQYREQLKQKLEETKNEPDAAEETEAEEHNNRSEAMLGNDNAAGARTVETENVEAEAAETKDDMLITPVPKIDANVAQRINDISMSGRSGEVYQNDVNVEMNEFRNKFNYENMNPQQKEYFRERLNSFAGLVGSSYNEMASKRLSAGPSWIVAGPAKYNTKRFNQKMEAERRAYETFEEKKEKFIKNTEKKLKELKYTGGTENAEDIKKRVFDDYSKGKWSYGDKIDNTDPYAIEKITGKIKYMEDVHNVTLLYNKICKQNGLANVTWADRTDEERAKRKEVISQTAKEAREKEYSEAAIKEGINSPFIANQTAEIRRNKQRLEELQKRQEVIEEKKKNESGESGENSGRVDFDGGYIYENPELDRIQIIYDSKPERDVIDRLKHHGFRWSPSQGAWQRQLNRNGRRAVNDVMAATGIDTKIDLDGAGKIAKSLPTMIIYKGRYLIKK